MLTFLGVLLAGAGCAVSLRSRSVPVLVYHRIGADRHRADPEWVPLDTFGEQMRYLAEHRDDIRQLLLREPRGNVIRSANVVLPSNHPEAQLGYVVMESTEYPVMSGSNTICVATVVLETGLLPMAEPITELVLESPAGLIRLTCINSSLWTSIQARTCTATAARTGRACAADR